jgi:hypothetical protein
VAHIELHADTSAVRESLEARTPPPPSERPRAWLEGTRLAGRTGTRSAAVVGKRERDPAAAAAGAGTASDASEADSRRGRRERAIRRRGGAIASLSTEVPTVLSPSGRLGTPSANHI